MRIKDRYVFAVLLVTAFAAYSNSFNVPFIFDDSHTVLNNKGIRDLTNLKEVFTSDAPGRPLLFLSFALNYAAGQLNPFGYHVVNFILHAATACVVYLILSALLERVGVADRMYAACGALLFAVHPMALETVTYISSRSDGMAAFFYLFAFLLIIRGGLATPAGRLGTAAVFAAALLTKETAVTLPALALVLLIVFEDREKWKEWRFGLGILWLMLPAWFLYRMVATGHPLEQNIGEFTSPRDYFLTQLTIVPFSYLPRLFVPINQILDADLNLVKSATDPVMWAGAAVIGSLLAFAFIRHRDSKIYAFSILWFLGAISVSSSFYPIYDTYAERRVYLPLPAFCLAVSYTLYRVSALGETARKRALAGALAVIAVFGALTFRRNHLYGNTIAILEDNLTHTFANARMRLALFWEYLKIGQNEKAEELMLFAAKAFPENQTVLLHYCWLLGYQGKFDRLANELAKTKPYRKEEWVMYHDFKGVLEGQKGNYAAAMRHFQSALSFDPGHVDTHANVIVLLNVMGKPDKATQYARDLIKNEPDVADYHFQLGMALADTDGDAAIAEFRATLKLNPHHRKAKLALQQLGVAG